MSTVSETPPSPPPKSPTLCIMKSLYTGCYTTVAMHLHLVCVSAGIEFCAISSGVLTFKSHRSGGYVSDDSSSAKIGVVAAGMTSQGRPVHGRSPLAHTSETRRGNDGNVCAAVGRVRKKSVPASSGPGVMNRKRTETANPIRAGTAIHSGQAPAGHPTPEGPLSRNPIPEDRLRLPAAVAVTSESNRKVSTRLTRKFILGRKNRCDDKQKGKKTRRKRVDPSRIAFTAFGMRDVNLRVIKLFREEGEHSGDERVFKKR